MLNPTLKRGSGKAAMDAVVTTVKSKCGPPGLRVVMDMEKTRLTQKILKEWHTKFLVTGDEKRGRRCQG